MVVERTERRTGMRSDSSHRPSSTSSPVGERHECISDGHGRRSDRTVRTGGGPGPRRERVVAVAEFRASLLTVHVPATMRRADTPLPLVLDTTELRWFVPGSLPAEVAVWFTGSTGVLEERSDTYLSTAVATSARSAVSGRRWNSRSANHSMGASISATVSKARSRCGDGGALPSISSSTASMNAGSMSTNRW